MERLESTHGPIAAAVLLSTALSAALSAVLTTGCAGEHATSPPPELVGARSAYVSAAASPAATFDPGDLAEARILLLRAEAEYKDAGASHTTRAQAYLAMRRAQLAEANGFARARMRTVEQAEQDALEATRTQLTSARAALAEAEHRLADHEERQANHGQTAVTAPGLAHMAEDDKSAREQAEGVTELQGTDDARGRVFLLPGMVLFSSGKSTLLPTGAAMLEEVIHAARDLSDRAIRIEGYTDNTGGPALNVALSQSRAQAVRDYLVSKGIAGERISFNGFGAARPLAANSTPAGRAANRRVEVILTKPTEGRAHPSAP